MAASEHPVFLAPDDPKATIWRYMDLPKYMSMLQNRCLWFARARCTTGDPHGDAHEGSIPAATVEARQHRLDHLGPPVEVLEHMGASDSRQAREEANWTYLNCWHMSKHESAAMWKIYGRSLECVAVLSSYQRLCEALPEDVHVGVVRYIDYDADFIEPNNSFAPFMHKQRAFEYEQEIRAVTRAGFLPRLQHEVRKWNKNGRPAVEAEPPPGKTVVVPLEKLIEAVYVGPLAPKWFFDIVTGVTAKYGLGVAVVRSGLDDPPLF